MLKIAVNGAEGRMGRLITETIEGSPDAKVALKLDKLQGKSLFLQENIPIDVLIDFTRPTVTLEYLQVAKQRKIPVVIGTTGFNDAEKSVIMEIAKEIPIVLSPNMSIGMNVTYKLLELATSILQDKAEVALLDIHHKHKLDAPSGTSLRMKEIIQKSYANYSKNSSKKDEPFDINIASIRMGDAIGDHSAFFALSGEQIEITHRAMNRALFAEGALQAAKWLKEQKPGLYDMQDVLGLRS